VGKLERRGPGGRGRCQGGVRYYTSASRSHHLLCDGWDSVGTSMALQDTSPPSSFVIQPKNEVAGMFILQESRDIADTQQCQHAASAPSSSCEPGTE